MDAVPGEQTTRAASMGLRSHILPPSPLALLSLVAAEPDTGQAEIVSKVARELQRLFDNVLT